MKKKNVWILILAIVLITLACEIGQETIATSAPADPTPTDTLLYEDRCLFIQQGEFCVTVTQFPSEWVAEWEGDFPMVLDGERRYPMEEVPGKFNGKVKGCKKLPGQWDRIPGQGSANNDVIVQQTITWFACPKP